MNNTPYREAEFNETLGLFLANARLRADIDAATIIKETGMTME